MQAVIVIRRRPAGRFPQAARVQVADLLRWSPDAVAKTLTGAGWAWLPGSRTTVEAVQLTTKLRDFNLQAGLVSATDAAGIETTEAFHKVSISDADVKLHATTSEVSLSKTNPGGAALIGLRWDGQTLRPFSQGVKKPALIAWGSAGPIGIFWLRENPRHDGMSLAELSSFLQQAVTRNALRLVDDSFRGDDIPNPSRRFEQAWRSAGGDAADTRALVHAVMLRSLQQSGVLSSSPGSLPNLEAPLRTYSLLQREWSRPAIGRVLAWVSLTGALLARRFFPDSPFTLAAGFGAGLLALIHGMRTVGGWLRLKARPLAKLRSMAVGPTRIRGEAVAAMELISPTRGLRCIYYKTKHERRGPKGGWQTVTTQESPNIPFYLRDDTHRVLVDTLGADWSGLESYTHTIDHAERIREWVYAAGMQTEIFGFAAVDPNAPVVQAVREGLEALFLSENGNQFDLNHDGVISDVEQKIALNYLEEQLKADRGNLTLSGGVHIVHTANEPLIISSQIAFPLGLRRGAMAAAWIVLGVLLFLGTFVYPETFYRLLRETMNAHHWGTLN